MNMAFIFFFWGDENIVKLIVVMAAQLCDYNKKTELYTLGKLYGMLIVSQ